MLTNFGHSTPILTLNEAVNSRWKYVYIELYSLMFMYAINSYKMVTARVFYVLRGVFNVPLYF